MNEWYEVAVSYKMGHGTETIATFDTLKEAKLYADNCDALEREYVDFLFIDKWYSEDDYENVMVSDKPAIIINKGEKNDNSK